MPLKKLSKNQKKELDKHKKELIEKKTFNKKDLNKHMRTMRMHIMRGKQFNDAHKLTVEKDKK